MFDTHDVTTAAVGSPCSSLDGVSDAGGEKSTHSQVIITLNDLESWSYAACLTTICWRSYVGG